MINANTKQQGFWEKVDGEYQPVQYAESSPSSRNRSIGKRVKIYIDDVDITEHVTDISLDTMPLLKQKSPRQILNDITTLKVGDEFVIEGDDLAYLHDMVKWGSVRTATMIKGNLIYYTEPQNGQSYCVYKKDAKKIVKPVSHDKTPDPIKVGDMVVITQQVVKDDDVIFSLDEDKGDEVGTQFEVKGVSKNLFNACQPKLRGGMMYLIRTNRDNSEFWYHENHVVKYNSPVLRLKELRPSPPVIHDKPVKMRDEVGFYATPEGSRYTKEQWEAWYPCDEARDCEVCKRYIRAKAKALAFFAGEYRKACSCSWCKEGAGRSPSTCGILRCSICTHREKYYYDENALDMK